MHLKDVKPLDLKDLLGSKSLKDRINLVGVELEGGWKELPKGINLVHDGSVKIPPPANSLDPMTGRPLWKVYSGELPSTPLPVKEYPTWVRKYYPSHINDTCGLHVHYSFTCALHYSLLMVPEYPKSIVVGVQEWAEEEKLPKDHPIWDRLAGKNTACQHLFHADLQVGAGVEKGHDRMAVGHRYTVIGYPYPRHTTIECRLLPGFENKEQAIRGIQRVLDITNASLVVLGRRGKEERFTASVSASRGQHVVSTFQGAHLVGREIRDDADEVLREEMRVQA